MKMRVPFLFVVALTLLSASIAFAQTTSFTYQGNLNTSGTPANGNHDFEFAMFNGGGVQIGATLTRLNVPVTTGVFAVELDFGNQFQGADRFLEIRVKPAGGGAFVTLAPRQLITSAPHAIRSLDSAQLGGISASQYIQSGAATINASSQFSIANVPVLRVQSGNSTFVGQNTGSSNTGVDNSFFGNAAGRFNTTGFSNSFFGSNAGFQNNIGQSNSFFGSRAGNGNSSGSRNSFFGDTAGENNSTGSGNTYLGFATRSSFGNFSNMTAIGAHAFVTQSNSMVLGSILDVNGGTSNTRVGIGVPDPVSRLTVAGDGSGLFSGNGTSFLLMNKAAGKGYGQSIADDGTLRFFSTTHIDNTNVGMARVAFDAIGNVGIGTQTPARRLHVVNGTSEATSISTADFVIEDNTSAFQQFLTPDDVESGILFGDVTDSVAGGIVFNSAATNNGIQFRTGGNTTRMTLNASGNLGIGTTAPINRLTIGTPETPVLNSAVGIFNAGGTFLTVRDTTNDIEGFIGADSNGVLFGSLTDSIVRIRTGNVNRLTFDSSGNAIFSGIVSMNSFTAVNTLDTGGATPLCRNGSNRISTCSSSLRYKSNVNDFTPGLNLVNRLKPVSFNWKDGGMQDLGLVAEDVAKVEPLLTTMNDKGQVEGVKYDRVGVVLVNAVKEQQTQIEELQRIVNEQQKQIDAFKKLICSSNSSADICKVKE
jgi:hypothetical protein